MKRKVYPVIIAILSLVFFVYSCDLLKDDNPTDPDDNSSDKWTYLSTTDYPIESTDGFRINDSISGGIFEFPTGGSGLLTIKRIIKAPNIEGEANTFEIQFDQANNVLFHQKHEPGDIDYLMTYTFDEYIQLNDDTTRTNWYALEVLREENGYYIYDLNPILSKTDISDISQTLNKITIKAISINFPNNSTIAKKSEEFKIGVEEVVDKLINVLPTNLQDDAKKKYKAKSFTIAVYNNKFSENSWNFYKHGNSYKPFSPYMGSEWRHFIFLDDADITNLAHETGHFFHHFSIGNSNFKNIMKNAIKIHAPSTIRSRSDISEEPAYLTECFINDRVKQIPLSIQTVFGNNYNELTDIPSLEGFTTLMCYLPIKNNANITKFDGTRFSPPEIKSISWTDVFKMVYENTNNVNDFRTKLEEILSKNNEEYKYLILLQAMGWNYKVKCRFVDQNQNPLSGVEARFVSIYKPEQYSLNLGLSPSGSDGKYQFNHSYPGKAKIRVYLNNFKDSLDLQPFEIDWKKPTNEIIDLGDITLSSQGPVITNVSPTKGTTSSDVKLSGKNFKEWGELYLNEENIYFNDWKDTEILFKVPSSAKPGINKIYVKVNNVKSNEVEFDVQLPVSKLDIEPAVSIIDKGATVQLVPKMYDQDGNPITDRIVKWNTYASDIISLTDKGLVSGLKEGIATVTATTDFAYNKCHVCISEPDPSLKKSDKIDGWGGLAVEYNINGIALSEYQSGMNRTFSGFPIGSTISLTAKVYGPYSIEGSWETNASLYINSEVVEQVRAPDKGGEQGWTYSFKTVTIPVDDNIKKNGVQVYFSVGYSRSTNSEGIGVVFKSKPCNQ